MSQNIDRISNNKGKKYIGHMATVSDFKLFIIECFKEDTNILPYINNFISEDLNFKDPLLPDTWEIYQICTDLKNFDTVNGRVYNLQSYFDNATHWGGYALYYKGENDLIEKVNQNKIRQVATMWMPYYDTTYRINIFDTIDDYLMLGINESD